MGTLNSLAAFKPSENSGSMASNRFDYQRNWALKKMLELEENDEDYIIIFDYHDDIVICNSQQQSDFIDFYQIKTRVGNAWTISNFKKEKEENLGILSKLIKHTVDFKECRNLYFVTNSYLAKSVYSKNADSVRFDELGPNVQDSFKKLVKGELHDVELANNAFAKLTFIQNQMDVNEYRHTLIGILTQFFQNKYKLTDIDISIIYDNLIKQIKGLNDYEGVISSEEELLKHKSMSHRAFRKYLNGVSTLQSFKEKKEMIRELLNRRSISLSNRHVIIKNLNDINCKLKDYENTEIRQLIALIDTTIDDNEPLDDDSDEWSYTLRLYGIIGEQYNDYTQFGEDFIKALILYQYVGKY